MNGRLFENLTRNKLNRNHPPIRNPSHGFKVIKVDTIPGVYRKHGCVKSHCAALIRLFMLYRLTKETKNCPRTKALNCSLSKPGGLKSGIVSYMELVYLLGLENMSLYRLYVNISLGFSLVRLIDSVRSNDQIGV